MINRCPLSLDGQGTLSYHREAAIIGGHSPQINPELLMIPMLAAHPCGCSLPSSRKWNPTAMKRYTTVRPSTTRYEFDFKLCNYQNGWAQLDTTEDASTYGNWVHPNNRMLVTYAEGDVTVTTCDDDAEFIVELRNAIAWHRERGSYLGIDPMCSESIEASFVRLGFQADFHDSHMSTITATLQPKEDLQP